jgi:hypothetical protein
LSHAEPPSIPEIVVDDPVSTHSVPTTVVVGWVAVTFGTLAMSPVTGGRVSVGVTDVDDGTTTDLLSVNPLNVGLDVVLMPCGVDKVTAPTDEDTDTWSGVPIRLVTPPELVIVIEPPKLTAVVDS